MHFSEEWNDLIRVKIQQINLNLNLNQKNPIFGK